MSDCLYGKLNSETIIEKYEGVESGTAKVSIDSKNRIEAEVLKTPKILTITKNSKSGNEIEYKFDGSADINIDLHEVDVYSGKSSNGTTSVIVDKEENSIDVQVLKTPGTLTITQGEEELGQFNGSESLSIDIPEYTGIENDTANIYINNNNIEVNVKALPTDNSIITGQNIVDSFGDLNNYITNVFDDLRSTQSRIDGIDGDIGDLRNQILPIQEDISNIEEDINQLETTTSILTTIGDGDKYLSDDGQYKEISGFNFSLLPKYTNKVKVSLSSSLSGLLTLPIVASSNFVVDWGDGTEVEEYKNDTTVITHQYSNISFTGWITIYGEWGGINFNSSSSDNNKLSLNQIIYDRNITSIPDYGLHGCYITKIEVSDDFEQFGKHSLENTYSLKEIKYPERSARFLEYACASSMLGYIKLTLDSGWGAPKYAFQSNNSLKTVEILESSMTTVQIHNSQFRNCNQLYSVKLSRNVNKLDTYAFYGCRKLTQLEIPEGTETFTISSSAIPYVTDLTIRKEVPAVLSSTNALPANMEMIRVPSSNLYSYKTGSNWSTFADKIYPIGGQYSETVTIPVAN